MKLFHDQCVKMFHACLFYFFGASVQSKGVPWKNCGPLCPVCHYTLQEGLRLLTHCEGRNKRRERSCCNRCCARVGRVLRVSLLRTIGRASPPLCKRWHCPDSRVVDCAGPPPHPPVPLGSYPAPRTPIPFAMRHFLRPIT
jgi:hypothetical protein